MANAHFRLLITGSRTWTDEEVMQKLLKKIYDQVKDRDPILIHGTAMGADHMASVIWLELGGAVEPHPADWYPAWRNGRYYGYAGYDRNQRMVDSGANLCIAFIHNNSKGASHCARLAERAGIKTWRITRDD